MFQLLWKLVKMLDGSIMLKETKQGHAKKVTKERENGRNMSFCAIQRHTSFD